MENTQNTHPHAELHLRVDHDLQVNRDGGLQNGMFMLAGCPHCIAKAIAEQMIKHPPFRNTIFEALLLYSGESAKKQSNEQALVSENLSIPDMQIRFTLKALNTSPKQHIAAKRLGISERTLARWKKDFDIRWSRKRGGYISYREPKLILE
jgi:hypothetical protein